MRALEARLRGFCTPSMFLASGRYAAGDPDDMRRLVSKIVQTSPVAVQTYLSDRGLFTPLCHYTGQEWYDIFVNFVRQHMESAPPPEPCTIVPWDIWRKRTLPAAKMRLLLNFVGILKALVPGRPASLAGTVSYADASQVLSAPRVESVEGYLAHPRHAASSVPSAPLLTPEEHSAPSSIEHTLAAILRAVADNGEQCRRIETTLSQLVHRVQSLEKLVAYYTSGEQRPGALHNSDNTLGHSSRHPSLL